MARKQTKRLIRQLKPDVVLLDWLLFDIDGYRVIEEMRQDCSLKDIPVIVIFHPIRTRPFTPLSESKESITIRRQ